MTYELHRNYCQCHPETCTCNNYRIVGDGKVIAKGDDKHAMWKLVCAANKVQENKP